MHSVSVFDRGLTGRAMLIAFFIGLNAALPMYLWQSNVQLAVATFIIVGYTAWLWAATWQQTSDLHHLASQLKFMPINRFDHRVGRMVRDLGFWWSMCFGASIISGSVWYVGVQNLWMLIGISCGWCMVAAMLNYTLTLLHPTTRCRRCHYQLVAHLDTADPTQRVTCPECGKKNSKVDLGLVRPPSKRKRRRNDKAVIVSTSAPHKPRTMIAS